MIGIIHVITMAWLLVAGPEIAVQTVEELKAAVAAAKPGDTIVVMAGTYDLSAKIACNNPGTSDAPITVRSEKPGAALIRFDSVQGFHVRAPFWVFEDLDIEGVCANHSKCEHAFHVTGEADSTVIRGCVLHEYNAHIKGNGEGLGPGGAYVWPDDVVIEYNEMKNSSARNTSNPVTPIDVVGGRRWILRGNFIHDHAKGGGNKVSYAAFLKGNSRDGLIERNLVICELEHKGQIRLGLSLGGGGSNPPKICEDGACTPEHQGGVLRNNIIVNCPADVGIYLNKASDTQLYNNTLFNTTGIDIRFEASTADLRNNVLDGKIRNRDGGTHTQGSNLAQSDLTQWFANPAAADFTLVDGAGLVDQGEALSEVTDDFCTNDRNDGLPDIGAVEYDDDGVCITTAPYVPLPDDPPGTTDGDVVDLSEPPPDTGEGEDTVAPEPPPDTAGEEDAVEPVDTDSGGPAIDSGSTLEPSSGGCQHGRRSSPSWPLLCLCLWVLARARYNGVGQSGGPLELS
jgi:parallel beta-helix repeat protein